MARVFMTQRMGNLNVEPASEYGEIKSIFPPGVQAWGTDTDMLLQICVERLYDVTEDDYLLIIGDPVLSAMAYNQIAKHLGRVRMLKWDRRFGEDGGYRIVEVNYGGVDDAE
jgi:hypothetical protein